MNQQSINMQITNCDQRLIQLTEERCKINQENCVKRLMEFTQFLENHINGFLAKPFVLKANTGEKQILINEESLIRFQATCNRKLHEIVEYFQCGNPKVFVEQLSSHGHTAFDGPKEEVHLKFEEYDGGDDGDWSTGNNTEIDEDPTAPSIPRAELDPLVGKIQSSPKKHYQCEICSERLTTKRACKIHLRTHTGKSANKKTFECDICQKQFVFKQYLESHMRTHSKERPYMCHVCSVSFKQSSPFHRHMRTHKIDKPYKCPTCGRGFIEKTYVKVHMQSHTGERPHKCPVCQRGYSKRYHVRKHLRNFHKVADVDGIFPHTKRASGDSV